MTELLKRQQQQLKTIILTEFQLFAMYLLALFSVFFSVFYSLTAPAISLHMFSKIEGQFYFFNVVLYV